MGMQHFPQEQAKELPSMGLEGIWAYLSETVCSDNEQAPITIFKRLENCFTLPSPRSSLT